MDEKIEAYAKGRFDVKQPEIAICTDTMHHAIFKGEKIAESFVIKSKNGIPVQGNVEVYDAQIQLVKGTVTQEAYVVEYTVSAMGQDCGQHVKGQFHVVTNGGEYEVPYDYEVVAPYMETSTGMIYDLQMFAAFARENWEEAVRIFQSDAFLILLQDKEMLRRTYQCLKKSVHAGQALEEFLVCTGCKEQLEIKPYKQEITILYDQEDVARTLHLKKSTWGYVNLDIRCTDKAVYIARSHITQDDFLGDTCEIPIVIAIDQLKEQRQTIALTVTYTCREFTILLDLKKKQINQEKNTTGILFSTGHLKKTYQKQLLQDYMAFRTGKMALKEYTQRSAECAGELIKLDTRPHLYRLLRLHMKLMQKDSVHAAQEWEIIAQQKDKIMENPLEKCYYAYLCCLYKKEPDQIRQTISMIRNCFDEHPDNFLIFWLLMYLDERYARDKKLLFQELMRILAAGGNSPMLFYEICELYNEQPMLIRNWSVPVYRCLYWGARRQMFGQTVREQIMALVSGARVYDPHIFRLLDMLYRQKPEPKLLHAICSHLIKGRKTQQQYHEYYEQGVKHSLKLLGLMESYIKSSDMQDYTPFPIPVVLYFQYEGHRLSDREMAYLYANITVNQKQYGHIYEEYEDKITDFLLKQIQKGAVNDSLVILYQAFLKHPEFLAAAGKNLENIIFKQKLTCSNASICSAVVWHDESCKMQTVAFHHHTAYVDIVTDHTQVILVDQEQNCYMESVPCELTAMFEDEKYLPYCYEADPDNFKVLLRLAQYAEQTGETDYETVKVYKSLLHFEELASLYRKRLYGKILRYYAGQQESDVLQDYLLHTDLTCYTEQDRIQAVTLLITQQCYPQAYPAVRQCGYQRFSDAVLLEFCTGMLEEKETEDFWLLTVIFWLFDRDCYNEVTLRYLVKYAKGCTKNLIAIYNVAVQLQFNTQNLKERILKQAMLAGEYPQTIFAVFTQYVKEQAEPVMEQAFENVQAYRYFMQKQPVPAGFFDMLIQKWMRRETLSGIEKIAVMSFLAEHLPEAKTQENMLQEFMQEYIAQDMIFPFWKKFAGVFALPEELYVKTFLVYRTKPGHTVCLHYIDPCDGKTPCTEQMREYFSGYFVKDFVLFADEQLEYYLEDSSETEMIRVEKEQVECVCRLKGSKVSRFERINAMLQMQKQQQRQECAAQMETYRRQCYLMDTDMTLL